MVNSALTHPYGTNDDIVSFLSTIYMGMETAVVILGFIAAILVHKYKVNTTRFNGAITTFAMDLPTKVCDA